MNLSIMCVTQGRPCAWNLLEEMQGLARQLNAQFVIGAHGEAAASWAIRQSAQYWMVEGTYMEEMLDPVIKCCTGDYILRLDDDEKCSPGMVDWLSSGEWAKRDSWFFSRCHLWPDPQHFLSAFPYFPDYQARLTVKRQARRPVKLHAAHAYPAYRAPGRAFLEHHVFLTKTRAERQALTAHYETLRTGVYFPPEKVDVVFPYDEPREKLVIRPVGSDGQYKIVDDTIWWREVGQRLPANLEQELKEFRESLRA